MPRERVKLTEALEAWSEAEVNDTPLARKHIMTLVGYARKWHKQTLQEAEKVWLCRHWNMWGPQGHLCDKGSAEGSHDPREKGCGYVIARGIKK